MFSNLPVYYMSLSRMPQGIVKELNKIQSAFLWGGIDLKRRIHLVKWKDASVSKKLGGLGIRNTKTVNENLLAKWWWRLRYCFMEVIDFLKLMVEDGLLSSWLVILAQGFGVIFYQWHNLTPGFLIFF